MAISNRTLTFLHLIKFRFEHLVERNLPKSAWENIYSLGYENLDTLLKTAHQTSSKLIDS
jgi:hypothetical protein